MNILVPFIVERLRYSIIITVINFYHLIETVSECLPSACCVRSYVVDTFQQLFFLHFLAAHLENIINTIDVSLSFPLK